MFEIWKSSEQFPRVTDIPTYSEALVKLNELGTKGESLMICEKFVATN